MSAPRRLADGTWSDGVERSAPLYLSERRYPNGEMRASAYKGLFSRRWFTDGYLEGGYYQPDVFDTHAEAIANADKAARHDH